MTLIFFFSSGTSHDALFLETLRYGEVHSYYHRIRLILHQFMVSINEAVWPCAVIYVKHCNSFRVFGPYGSSLVLKLEGKKAGYSGT